MTEIITLTISKELRDKIDLTRGDIPRSKFISRSLEAFFRSRAENEDLKSNVLEKQMLDSLQISCEICNDVHRTYRNLQAIVDANVTEIRAEYQNRSGDRFLTQ